MTLKQFKYIWKWENRHRWAGRILGGWTLIGGLGICSYAGIAGGSIKLIPKCFPIFSWIGLLGLGGCQAFIGKWMVDSGLQEGGNGTFNNLAKVSPYRFVFLLQKLFFPVFFW